MTTPELLNQAESTYPPTRIVLQTVCGHIGTSRQIAEALRLGPYGRQRVRNWCHSSELVPFPVWLALLAIDGAKNA